MQTYSVEEFKRTYKIESEKQFYLFLESLGVEPRVLFSFFSLNPNLMRLVEQERQIVVTEVGKEKDFIMYFSTIANSTHSYMLTIRDKQIKLSSAHYTREGNGIYQYGKVINKSVRVVNGKLRIEKYGIKLEPKNKEENVLTYFGDLGKKKEAYFSLSVSAYSLTPSTLEEARAVDLFRGMPEMMLLEKERIVGTNNINGISQQSLDEDMHSFEQSKAFTKIV